MVRAKFVVYKKTQSMGSVKNDEGKWVSVEVNTIEMSPVSGNGDPNHENTKFWQASPSGKFEIGVIPKEVGDSFKLGKEYYIDITEV